MVNNIHIAARITSKITHTRQLKTERVFCFLAVNHFKNL